MTVLYMLILLPIVFFGTVVVLWILLVYPRESNMPMPDTLLLAAHSDDCVIMAGEYGIECIKRGKTLKIFYMTCGAESADAEAARVRRAEAERAWSKAALAPEHLTFMDAPQSQVDGEPNQSEACLERVSAALREAIVRLPLRSAVILPAAAERHVDHRTLRRIAIAAIHAADRNDIVIYEAPTYSNYISLFCNPFRALRVLLGFLPVGWRIAKRITFDAPYVYYATFGLGALRLPAEQGRLRLKREMLSMFNSQGGDGLRQAFGRPDVLRRLKAGKALREKERPFGLRIGHVVCASSTLLFACTAILSILATIAAIVVIMARR